MVRAVAGALVLWCFAAIHDSRAQTPRVELDHAFIVVAPGAKAEIAALRAAGFILASEPRRHEGQGTASVAAYFENAYLELIWVDATVTVTSEHSNTVAWFRAAASWRTNGHSPFGLGLRRVAGDTSALPVPVERETAAWLEPGTAYELLHQASDSLAADLFVVPALTAVPKWIGRARQREPELWQHLGGGREITLVRVHGLPQHHPAALDLLRPGRVETEGASWPLLELQLDSGVRGERVDLRPTLPLVIVR
jgi:hypothetical protein